MTEQTKKHEKLPLWFTPVWSTGTVAVSVNMVFISYITYYCTDMLGMSAVLIGTLLLISKLFDGVTDLIVGFIIDKTNTRWGKARPYEICIVFIWLLTVLLFSVPDAGKTVQAAYVFIMYTLSNAVCMTCLNGSGIVYLSRSVREEENRTKVLSGSGAIVMIFTMGISILMPQLMTSIGTTKAGWRVIAAMIAIPMAIIGMLRFIFIKEVVVDEEPQKIKNHSEDQKTSFKQMLLAIVRNKYIFLVAGALLIINIVNNMGAATTYYFKYIIGDIGLQSFVSLTTMLVPLALIIYPVIVKRIGNTNMFRLGSLLGVIGLLIRSVGGANMVTILIGTALFQIGFIPIGMMVGIYVLECMDYGEWKNGYRIEAPLNSVTSFATKLGSALASSLTGIIMGLAGYDGSLAVQSDLSIAAIIGTYNYLPLALYVIVFILSIFYDMDKKKPQIQADLEARRGKRSSSFS